MSKFSLSELHCSLAPLSPAAHGDELLSLARPRRRSVEELLEDVSDELELLRLRSALGELPHLVCRAELLLQVRRLLPEQRSLVPLLTAAEVVAPTTSVSNK